MDTTVFKEGQIYVCTKSNEEFWTVGKEYISFTYILDTPVLISDDGNTWSFEDLKDSNTQFELKDPTIDLKTEIIYWKDTSRYYQDKLKEIQKILNKTLDN